MNTCLDYKIRWFDLIFPSTAEFSTVCKSNDKTYLFLVGFARFILYSAIFSFLYERGVIKYSLTNYLQTFSFLFFAVSMLISLLLLIIIITKKQKYDKVDKVIVVEEEIKKEEEIIPIAVFKDDLTATRAQRESVGF